ncbi:hypothetical protein BGZ63DRAFT_326507, partial [Mariannaea sp. PMI_226]
KSNRTREPENMNPAEAVRRLLSLEDPPINSLDNDIVGNRPSFPLQADLDKDLRDFNLLRWIYAKSPTLSNSMSTELLHSTQKHLAGSRFAVSSWHIDYLGFLTVVKVEEGAKLWLSCPGMSLAEVGEFAKSREPPQKPLAMYLEDGYILVQPPCVPHFVVGLLPTILTCWMWWCTQWIPNILRQAQLELKHPDVTN